VAKQIKDFIKFVQKLTTPAKGDTLFLVMMLASVSLWSLDLMSTQVGIWKYGIGYELNPTARNIFIALENKAVFYFMAQIMVTHFGAWLLYRAFPVAGYMMIAMGLTNTIYTNFHNFFLR